MNAFTITDDDIQSCRNNIELFKSFRLKKMTHDNLVELSRVCYWLCGKIPLTSIQINVPYILRGRTNEKGEIFHSESQISEIREDLFKIKLGRFNCPEESIFYGSMPNEIGPEHLIGSVVRECCKDFFLNTALPCKYVTIGRWHLKSNFQVLNLCNDENTLSANPILKQLVQKFINHISENFQKNTAQLLLEFWTYLSELAGNKFENESDHFLTTIFFHAVILHKQQSSQPNINGILFPSTTTENQGLNIALLPESVNKYLTLNSVFMEKVTRCKNELHSYNIVPCSSESMCTNGIFKLECTL